MNRGKLEAWAVRLEMIRTRLMVPKAQKAEVHRQLKINVTRLNEDALIDLIDNLIIAMEVM